MYGKVKHTIRKHIEWATFRYINQEHSMKVCNDGVKRKEKKRPMVIGKLPPPLFWGVGGGGGGGRGN